MKLIRRGPVPISDPIESFCNILSPKSITENTHRLLGVIEYYLKDSKCKILPPVHTNSLLFLDSALYPWELILIFQTQGKELLRKRIGTSYLNLRPFFKSVPSLTMSQDYSHGRQDSPMIFY